MTPIQLSDLNEIMTGTPTMSLLINKLPGMGVVTCIKEAHPDALVYDVLVEKITDIENTFALNPMQTLIVDVQVPMLTIGTVAGMLLAHHIDQGNNVIIVSSGRVVIESEPLLSRLFAFAVR